MDRVSLITDNLQQTALMLKIEVYCSLLLLSIFVVSMLSSCSRSDINSTYALFSYFALLTHRHYNSLKASIVTLIVISLLIIGSDIWAISLLEYEQMSKANKIVGYIWIIGEIVLKVCLVVMLGVWGRHVGEREGERERERDREREEGNFLENK